MRARHEHALGWTQESMPEFRFVRFVRRQTLFLWPCLFPLKLVQVPYSGPYPRCPAAPLGRFLATSFQGKSAPGIKDPPLRYSESSDRAQKLRYPQYSKIPGKIRYPARVLSSNYRSGASRFVVRTHAPTAPLCRK